MNLTIISHTEHYKKTDGNIVGLGSTVTEINQLLEIFDKITHVAMLHATEAPPNALPYTSNRITFVPIPVVGGTKWVDKFQILIQAPSILKIIHRTLKSCDYFQFRAPTGIGVFVIPYLLFYRNKKGWFKYAGNWKQKDAPFAYRFQKWFLEKQSRPVTINGFWEDQPKQCVSFENPCLTEEELQLGQKTIADKRLQLPVELCFVGRLEAAKGVDLIIEALASFDNETRGKIRAIHMVGAGAMMEAYQQRVEALSLPVQFYGYLSRTEVHEIYKRSHAILLPSASEGFPKVIAEAMNYGCLPIVSNVSAIGQYIKDNENGFLLKNLNVDSLYVNFINLLELEEVAYRQMITSAGKFMKAFTYTNYNQRILKEIL